MSQNTASTDSSNDWTEPGVYEVAPGVHRVPLPLPNDGLRAVNIYAIADGDGLVFVDSGWSIPVARKLLDGALRTLDCSLADIHRFLVTHIHRDHYTQALEVRRETGTRVGLGAGEKPSMKMAQDPERRSLSPQIRQLHSLGADDLAEQLLAHIADSGDLHDPDAWEDPDDWLEPGEVTLDGGRRLDVVETPGHTQGHVVFHDRDAGLLFAGDHVLPTITPSIGFEPLLAPNPLGDFLESLAKVRAMPDALLLPAHGRVAPSVHARVDELIDHHGVRLDQTAAVVEAEGVATAADVAARLKWTRRGRDFADLDPFNQMLAMGETAAHLQLLVAQGRLARSSDDGTHRYQVS